MTEDLDDALEQEGLPTARGAQRAMYLTVAGVSLASLAFMAAVYWRFDHADPPRLRSKSRIESERNRRVSATWWKGVSVPLELVPPITVPAKQHRESEMRRGILLWMIGVLIPSSPCSRCSLITNEPVPDRSILAAIS